MDVVETELRLAEDSLVRLKRERLELEKIISTLLRQKTEIESEVALIVDSKYREDRDTRALREERLNLDTELVRIRSLISELRTTLSNLENARTVTEHELRGLESRKDRVDSYVSGMEARLLIGRHSPVSPHKDYMMTARDDLEKQMLELRERKLSLEADLFTLRRKSGDGIDTRTCGYNEGALGVPKVNIGYIGTTGSYGGNCRHSGGLQQVQSFLFFLTILSNTTRADFKLPAYTGRGLEEFKSTELCGQRFMLANFLSQDIEGLAQQKSKLSNEVQEMQVVKTDLDIQITNLEYRKLGLEQSGRLVTRQENESLTDLSGGLVTRRENEGLAELFGGLVARRENESLSELSGGIVTGQENGGFAQLSGGLGSRRENIGLAEPSESFMTRRENENSTELASDLASKRGNKSSELNVEENLTEKYSVQVYTFF